MATSRLKRLMGRRKPFRACVEDLAAMAAEPFAIVDADGRLLFGEDPGEGDGEPITDAGATVGRVHNGGDSVRIAGLLSRMVSLDTEKRALAR
ncbi:MAG: hypothetical protein GY884_15675, partial [Proteobacteria bacterium]|nr:hypothetical protein [Pseudomonadota bacterium]